MRFQPAAVAAVSVVLLAVVIVAVAAFGTTLLGVPTTYGSGVTPSLGAQVARDFLADQDAEATAVSNGDQSVLGGHLTDSALTDVVQQISNQPGSASPPAVSFHPASLTVLQAPDPADPSLTIEVQEDGTKSVITSGGPDAAPTEQTISFHGDFWLRKPGANYTIADQHIQTLPSSPIPAIGLVVAALLIVGLATVLVRRRGGLRQSLERAPALVTAPLPVQDYTPAHRAALEAPKEVPRMVVTTFGGLHIREGGQDWAGALMSRPVTGFVWLRLLVAAVRNPGSTVGRDEVARQASPRQSRDVQLKRLRNVIAKGLPPMPSVLRDRILVMPESMSFVLDGCEVDAIELATASAASTGRRDLSPSEVARLQRVLSACQGTFLSEFDSIEDLATDRHPTCTELIRELRESLTNKRVDLSLLVADAHLRTGQPAQAITVLEPALRDRIERKDVADRLAAAYRGAGREAEAKALEARFA
ncbi:MAG: AfsR/SARP family transcriptional regulator [Candidatus Dormibacteria bacterium]